MLPPLSLTCNCLLPSTTSQFATPDHHLSRSLTQLLASKVPPILCGVSLSLLCWGFMRVSLKRIFSICICFLTFESSTSLFFFFNPFYLFCCGLQPAYIIIRSIIYLVLIIMLVFWPHICFVLIDDAQDRQ